MPLLAWLTELGIALARSGAPVWDETALATMLALVVIAGAVHVGRIVLDDGRVEAPAFAPPSQRGTSVACGAAATRPAPLLCLLSVVRR